MKIDEKKLIEYLKNHIGENTTTWRLAVDSGVCEGMNNDEIDANIAQIQRAIHKIAEKNKFRLNNDHHYNEVIGLPWNIDFYIEEYDKEEVVKRIMNEPSMAKRIEMILDEYGIYDKWTGEFIELRYDFPKELKKIYKEGVAWMKENS